MLTMDRSPEPAARTSGQPWGMIVERGKIAEFAEAMQSDNPAYQGPDAIIPPTFLTTAARWAPPGVRVPIGFDRMRLLHGEQEYTFYGALPKCGDTLTAQETVVDRYEKPGKRGGTMRFATVVTDYRSPDGTLFAQAKATFIETARA
jgi:N-terminal half of MaoC dehydratase